MVLLPGMMLFLVILLLPVMLLWEQLMGMLSGLIIMITLVILVFLEILPYPNNSPSYLFSILKQKEITIHELGEHRL